MLTKVNEQLNNIQNTAFDSSLPFVPGQPVAIYMESLTPTDILHKL